MALTSKRGRLTNSDEVGPCTQQLRHSPCNERQTKSWDATAASVHAKAFTSILHAPPVYHLGPGIRALSVTQPKTFAVAIMQTRHYLSPSYGTPGTKTCSRIWLSMDRPGHCRRKNGAIQWVQASTHTHTHTHTHT